MSDAPNTLFLRLEGPLQAWGDPSKFVIRRTMDAPTKSGVIGLICCAMGLSRQAASACPIEREGLRLMADRLVENGQRHTILRLLGTLTMGVRVDRAGTRWWDYHTVGAGIGILRADGKGIKRTATTKEIETLITRREYLADASFLVALQGDPDLIGEVAKALAEPKWPPYLGRKCCPPSAPILVQRRESDGKEIPNPVCAGNLMDTLKSVPCRVRSYRKRTDESCSLECFVEWPTPSEDAAPPDTEVWYDVPVSFDPPVHEPRLVVRDTVAVEAMDPILLHTPPPPRPRADYNNDQYKCRRKQRLEADRGLCVFCKDPATTVQHVTYRHAGGDEKIEELRSLCRLCHDAVTMIEYGLGMGLDRINPEEPRWRERIIEKRDEIIRFRSLATRRRRLEAEEVE